MYVGAQLGWALQYGTIEPRPALAEYVSRLTLRPAAQRAHAIDDALVGRSAPAP